MVSWGRAALVSATTSSSLSREAEAWCDSLATGAYAGTDPDAPASVTAVLYASTTSAVDV